jgi:hypothetical protein
MNAEARLLGMVFFAVLPRRPDEHAADEDERDEHDHEDDDLCGRHCNSFTAKPRLAAEPLSEHPLAPRSLGATRTRIFEPPQALAPRRNRRHPLTQPRLGVGIVEIGEPERTYTVEPLEDPVPRERPGEPAQQPAGPSPAEEPVEPERVQAP